MLENTLGSTTKLLLILILELLCCGTAVTQHSRSVFSFKFDYLTGIYESGHDFRYKLMTDKFLLQRRD